MTASPGPLPNYTPPSEEALLESSRALLKQSRTRRSVRDFSERPVPHQVIENCLELAGTAPSGANQQPWHFAAVQDPEIKRAVREGAEEEERAFYQSRAPQAWLDALQPLGTDAHKPFLERAPWLIAIFWQAHTPSPDGKAPIKHYYPRESVGIATGMLIQTLHLVGLVSLTHTPSPMAFLNEILGRPPHEKPFLLLVVGYPADEVDLPKISKKQLSEFTSFH